jgi:peptide chain release factor 1
MQRQRSFTAFDVTLLEQRDGFLSFIVKGHRANIFTNEAGGHRWQRVPPTEKRGRTHTSTITVAVLPIVTRSEFVIKDSDLSVRYYRSSGPGGQNKNKTESAVEIIHKPTGISANCTSERSQNQNKAIAIRVLQSRLDQLQNQNSNASQNKSRLEQIGGGYRGEKIRTVREQDGVVKCERTGRSQAYSRYSKGYLFD